jgi:hypothetical protein
MKWAKSMTITTRDLRPADIIVSTTGAGISAAIRNMIGSSVSHCILYVGGANVVEAIDRGVVNNPLEEALSHATLAIALRRRNLTERQRNNVITAANGFVSRSLPYDTLGAISSGVYTRRGLALGMAACRVMLPFCPVATIAGANNARPTMRTRPSSARNSSLGASSWPAPPSSTALQPTQPPATSGWPPRYSTSAS